MNTDSLHKALDGSLNEAPELPNADTDGVNEGEEFSTLERDTKKDTSQQKEWEESAKSAEIEANKISHTSRRRILKWIEWPLCLGAALVTFMTIYGFAVLSVIEFKVGLKLFSITPAQLIIIMGNLPKGVLVLGGLIAPLSAFALALTAWLFRNKATKE